MPSHKYKNVPSKPEHEIQDLVDAIKEVVLEEKPKATVAKAFQIDRMTLKRYIAKVQEAELDLSTIIKTKNYLILFSICLKKLVEKRFVNVLLIFFLLFLTFFHLFSVFYRFSHNYKRECSGNTSPMPATFTTD